MGSDLSTATWPPSELSVKSETRNNSKRFEELKKLSTDLETARKELMAESEKYQQMLCEHQEPQVPGSESEQPTETGSNNTSPDLANEDIANQSESSRNPTPSEQSKSTTGEEEVEEEQESSESDINSEENVIKWIEELLDEHEVVFLSKQNCPFSADVRKILSAADLDFEEIKIESLDDDRYEVVIRVVEDVWKRFGLPVLWVCQKPTDTNELRQLQENGKLAEIHNAQFIKKMHAEIKEEEVVESEDQLTVVSDQPTESRLSSSQTVEEVPDIEIPYLMLWSQKVSPLCLDVIPSDVTLAVDKTNVFTQVGADKILELCTVFVEYLSSDTEILKMYLNRGISRQKLVQKLSGFLCERLGGPEGVTDHKVTQGSPSILCCPAMLAMRHAHLRLTSEVSTRWLQLMNDAVRSTMPPEVVPLLVQYFTETVKLLSSTERTEQSKLFDHRIGGGG